MSKYAAFSDALKSRPGSHWRVGFEEIEALLGSPLPGSAFRYPAWWSNNPSNNTMTPVWLNAGWKTADVDIPGRKVTFRKTGGSGPKPGPGMSEPPTTGFTREVNVELDPVTQEALLQLAVAEDTPIEAVAKRLLTEALERAIPSLRAARARQALSKRSDLPVIDLEAVVAQARDMH